MKMPRPSRPKAFISAPSSNSPIDARVHLVRACSQLSSCWRTDDAAPWISIGASFRHCGKSPLSAACSAGAQKKLIGVLPSGWLKALTLTRPRHRLVGHHQVQPVQRQLGQQVGKLAFAADQAHRLARSTGPAPAAGRPPTWPPNRPRRPGSPALAGRRCACAQRRFQFGARGRRSRRHSPAPAGPRRSAPAGARSCGTAGAPASLRAA